MPDEIAEFLGTVYPYSAFEPEALARTAAQFEIWPVGAGGLIYSFGEPAPGLFVVRHGDVLVLDADGDELSRLKGGNSFGERGLLRDGKAATTAHAVTDTVLYMLPPGAFAALMKENTAYARFFERGEARRAPERPSDLATVLVSALMTPDPLTCTPDTTVADAARTMASKRVSSLCVCDGDRLVGLLTIRDLSGRVLGAARPPDTPVREVMTADPLTLPTNAIGSDVLHAMMERDIGHIPVMDSGRLVGIVTRTDLIRRHAINSAWLVRDIARAPDAKAISGVTARIPELLVQLVGTGSRHDIVTRLITDIADAATRRLLALAEARLGPPPIAYLWLACGSQGRREQTGVSDQDNCLILDDRVKEADAPYFAALAEFVTAGLNTAGYVFCPGEMMASNPRWRQPLKVWKSYFEGWIATPNPEAQMLSSVMFDLRPVHGSRTLFERLNASTLEKASRNSIFFAHMVANSLKHQPPLNLMRGIATIRSGEHKHAVDLKLSGVVPIVDLARLYAIMGRIEEVNTRVRLSMAAGAGAISQSGARDLIDAFDLISETRLRHQARLVSDGEKPNNFLVPYELSDFERSHLRNAFVVVRTMQSAIGHSRGTVM